MAISPRPVLIEGFWERARAASAPNASRQPPEAWAFGATADHANGLLSLVLDEVSAEHAYSEGEGDRSLASWREIHERYWRHHSENPRGFEPDMPVVCERFRLLYSERLSNSGE